MTSPRRPRANATAAPGDAGGQRLAPIPEPTRGGDDVRRRGWFWHWNALVTQYAPLIGLKGVGLLNSYTVWTDRREESPHRGYAFPSQQSEADFYGEDRAELIAINKILVALDLIEIRKEMVPRTDPQGRRWKVPHNFYRVKDHGDDFTLSTPDVLRVAELAARDRAVYRYVRRAFSPRFAPIDSDNIWGRILPEVRRTPVWQELAARAAAEENRASARTRAGHAARKGPAVVTASAETAATSAFFVPGSGDEATTAPDSNDSGGVTKEMSEQTSVATINTGSGLDVAGSNRGSHQNRSGSVAPVNEAGPTDVAPTNTTYHQSSTTTNDETDEAENRDGSAVGRVTTGGQPTRKRQQTSGGPGGQPPADGPGEMAALRAFESANDRAATPAERKLLRDLAARLQPVAAAAAREREDTPGSGWGWIEAAVWEAVEAGSSFVAPRRLREILSRWEREGFPMPRDPQPLQSGPPQPEPPRGASRPGSRPDVAPRPPRQLPPVFAIDEVGLSNRQVWAATLAEMERRGANRAELDTWLRPAALIGRDGTTLIVGAPNAVARDRIATRLLPALRDAVAATIGVPRAITVVVEDAGLPLRLVDEPAS